MFEQNVGDGANLFVIILAILQTDTGFLHYPAPFNIIGFIKPGL